MSEQEAIKIELWRLGLLVSGRAAAATDALAALLRSQRDLRKVAMERARRLVIMALREQSAGGPDASPPGLPESARPAWRALGLLEPLQREAWVLRDVLGFGEIEAARITGVPKSALGSYLSEARDRVASIAGAESGAVARSLADWVKSAEATRHIAEAESRVSRSARRRRLIVAAQLALLAAAMVVFAWIGRDLLRASERERRHRALQNEVSNPMTQEEAARSRKDRGGSP